MRLGQFSAAETEQPWCGAFIDEERVVNLPAAGEAAGIAIPRRLSKFLHQWNWEEKARLVVKFASESDQMQYDLSTLKRQEPIAEPEKIIGVGLNYEDHAEEGDNPIPDEPVLFSKFPTAVTGPETAITWNPAYTDQVDYEAELVVVIGNEAQNIASDDAWEHVAGVTVGNDISARDLQQGDGQWVRGKSLDTFAPIGPDLVTLDDVDDPHDLAIWTEVNGERVQDSTTANLIFSINELVAFCSRAFTLKPGDLIFTGTPPGVGVYRDPQILLDNDDTVTVGIEGIGELTNICRHTSKS